MAIIVTRVYKKNARELHSYRASLHRITWWREKQNGRVRKWLLCSSISPSSLAPPHLRRGNASSHTFLAFQARQLFIDDIHVCASHSHPALGPRKNSRINLFLCRFRLVASLFLFRLVASGSLRLLLNEKFHQICKLTQTRLCTCWVLCLNQLAQSHRGICSAWL